MINLVSLDDEICSYGDYYCKDINAKFEVRVGSIKVTYLVNAMSSNTCRENVIYSALHDNVMDVLGVHTVKELEAIAYGDVEEKDYAVYHRRVKGSGVFNPFAECQKQKLTNLTVGKFVKAVLAGQVKNVVCAGKYTDDYADDAKRNYDKGVAINAMELAKKIVEDGSRHWRVWHEGNKVLLAQGIWNYYQAELA